MNLLFLNLLVLRCAFGTIDSDGGAGAGCENNANDGGGGAVCIVSPSITVGNSGSILANGGDGAGGGGSGGAIWMITPELQNYGQISALGGAGGCASPCLNPGGNGSEGRIRIDY